jgi:hypothetical protein
MDYVDYCTGPQRYAKGKTGRQARAGVEEAADGALRGRRLGDVEAGPVGGADVEIDAFAVGAEGGVRVVPSPASHAAGVVEAVETPP